MLKFELPRKGDRFTEYDGTGNSAAAPYLMIHEKSGFFVGFDNIEELQKEYEALPEGARKYWTLVYRPQVLN